MTRKKLIIFVVLLVLVPCCVLPTYADNKNSASLAEALRTIQGKEFVDLTQSFSPNTPVWSGFGQATMSAACDPKSYRPYSIEKDGFRSTFYSLVG
jgi:hypothetical protein